MSFLFRRSKRWRKSKGNRGLPIDMVTDKHAKPVRGRSETANYPQDQARPVVRARAQSDKLANKSLVNKILDKPANSIPDVIASHEGLSSREDSSAKSHASKKTRDETTSGEIDQAKALGREKYENFSFQAIETVVKVEERYEATSPKNTHSSTAPDALGKVEDETVQVHHPAPEVSSNNGATGSHLSDEEDLDIKEENLFFDPRYRKKRTSSITHSEKEALGTLDEVLRVFDDVDDNLHEVCTTDSKTSDVKPDTSDFDPTYETMADINGGLIHRDDMKPNGIYDSANSNYNRTASTATEKRVENLAPPTQPVYAKPTKPNNTTTSPMNPGKITTPRPIEEIAAEKLPVVPPKKFVEDRDHELKFSPLKATSPSASLSKSLNKTSWANANEIPSPKRKPTQNNNSNFSLKRGQLSGPAPVNTDDNYVEPPRDYDINTTLSSIGKSMTDESLSRDTWGSMTSSSTSGSRKVKKEFRPEVMKFIGKRNAAKGEKDEERHHDGLVNRSFRLIKNVSLKETASKSSEKEDAANQSDIENDYTTIKNEADLWLESYERIRANSEEKREPALKPSPSTTTNAVAHNNKELTSIRKADNGLPPDTSLPLAETTQAVLNGSRGSDDVQLVNGTSVTVETTEKARQTKNVKTEKVKSNKHSVPNEDNDLSDDENLVRLMETGIGAEDSADSPVPEPRRFGYVPRALRMSFGQSWEGIRKDRREWKSREMKQVSANAARKGAKSLSNRFDDQEAQLEMLF